MEHPSIYFMICILITIIANVVIMIKNLNKISIRKFEFSDNNSLLIISYKKGYLNTNYEVKLAYDSINFNH